MQYTIKTITHIIPTSKLQAQILFTFEGKSRACVGLVALSALATTDLTKIEQDPAFIAMCNATITAQTTPVPQPTVNELPQ